MTQESRPVTLPAEGCGQDVWAVVLAGGAGKRLQPFLRHALGAEKPKQFCRIVGTRSMLRHTWDRAAWIVPPDRMVTIITAGQEAHLAEEARRGVPGTVLVQPRNKETGPGLLYPLLWIARRAPGATVLVLPADHFVWEEERFAEHVRAAARAAQRHPDRLALLGVEADRPDPGYGWIAPGDAFQVGSAAEAYAVRCFWEKPDPRTAARLFACGYFWNTLVLAGHLAAYLDLAGACVPEVLEPLRAVQDAMGTPAEGAALAEAYHCFPSTNLSRCLLVRRPERLMVLVARGVYWSDWGDPERIVRTLRRFDRRPRWLPTYAPAQAQATGGA